MITSCALLVFLNFTPRSMFFGLDQATMMAVSKLMLRGEFPLLGPPSHIGGRHLGPLWFYHHFLGALVGQGDAFMTTVAVNAVTLLGLVALFGLLACFVERRLLPWAIIGAGFLLCTERYIAILRYTWQPSALVVYSSFVLFAAVRMSRRGFAGFPLLLLGASAALQMHLSSAPLIAVAVSYALLGAVRKPIALDRRRAIEGFLCIVCTALLWLGPLLFELRYPSNIAALLNVHGGGKETNLGFQVGLVETVRWLATYLNIGSIFGRDPVKAAAGALFLALFAVMLGTWWTRARPEHRLNLLLLFAVCAVYPFAVARVVPPFFDYYLDPLLPIPPLLFGIFFAEAVRRAFEARSAARRAAAAVLLAVLLFPCVRQIQFAVEKYSWKPVARWHSLLHAREVAAAIDADRGGSEENEFLFKGLSGIARDGILYEMNPPQYAQMSYAHSFTELPSFAASDRRRQQAYLFFCPTSDLRLVQRVWRKTGDEWELERNVDLSSCRTCNSCRLTVLKRRLQ